MISFGKYTDSCGNERNLDQYHMHELLDRLSVMGAMFEEHIASHPAAGLVRKDVEEISGRIGRLYQKVGELYL